MNLDALLQLATILVLGIAAQWIAWRLRVPSILLLLAAGLIAGPATGLLRPDAIFGELLLPLVSLCVAVILYEGGLNLKFSELKNIGGVLALLTTLGAAITWGVGTLAARFMLGFAWPAAALLGAILVVTGPTVIGPILRHLRLRGKLGALLKWEGIVIDPIGATFAVLVFAAVQEGGGGFADVASGFALTVVGGGVLGLAAAWLVAQALSRYWIPDYLHNPFSLMCMVIAFAAADHVHEESGLLAVTVMGIALANQKRAHVRHLVEFKEVLTVLFVSSLFVLLAARIGRDELLGLSWGSAGFVAAMILVARPLAVAVSTARSALSWRERFFVAAMAPRGIVAAAVASVFALALAEAGDPRASEMVSTTFLVVLSTVLVYGLGAAPLARALGLVVRNPQGVLFVGAHPWARAMAAAVQQEGFAVLLIDTDWDNVRDAKMAGLPALHGNALAESMRESIDYQGLGRMLALTANDEVNSLACLHFVEDFGRQEVYQLRHGAPAKAGGEADSHGHRGRLLFAKELDFDELERRFGREPKVKRTKLTEEFGWAQFKAQRNGKVAVLFVVRPEKSLGVITDPEQLVGSVGTVVFSVDEGGGEGGDRAAGVVKEQLQAGGEG